MNKLTVEKVFTEIAKIAPVNCTFFVVENKNRVNGCSIQTVYEISIKLFGENEYKFFKDNEDFNIPLHEASQYIIEQQKNKSVVQ